MHMIIYSASGISRSAGVARGLWFWCPLFSNVRAILRLLSVLLGEVRTHYLASIPSSLYLHRPPPQGTELSSFAPLTSSDPDKRVQWDARRVFELAWWEED